MCESCLERNKVYVNTKLYFECVTPREKCVDTFDWHFKQYAIYWLQYSFWLVRVDFMCGKIRGALGVWHLWDVCQLCKGGCKAVEQKKTQLNMLISVFLFLSFGEMDIEDSCVFAIRLLRPTVGLISCILYLAHVMLNEYQQKVGSTCLINRYLATH